MLSSFIHHLLIWALGSLCLVILSLISLSPTPVVFLLTIPKLFLAVLLCLSVWGFIYAICVVLICSSSLLLLGWASRLWYFMGIFTYILLVGLEFNGPVKTIKVMSSGYIDICIVSVTGKWQENRQRLTISVLSNSVGSISKGMPRASEKQKKLIVFQALVRSQQTLQKQNPWNSRFCYTINK